MPKSKTNPIARPLHQRIDDQRRRVFQAAGIVALVAQRILPDDDDAGGALEGAAELLHEAAMELDALESELRADAGEVAA